MSETRPFSSEKTGEMKMIRIFFNDEVILHVVAGRPTGYAPNSESVRALDLTWLDMVLWVAPDRRARGP